ncbi:hypothetical protein SMACR_04867 [Sordaria macrospora]|uniref:WGS project CABT00000000 data, contig 2.1 n=2 Tax=Sordaria macrospora TaxID=5147 RepID=F7VLU6_SORMK|nr:uncharacterized protein SMAC_04867 [Sordaria macrospora k-hell]KAA8634343.1 hypothetical protein SMACR_04867 [Sordaria macrospora]WPJ59442.1 hypothetical protein SMAC4_04867 [Sordaria macrospora]CCC06474.1 unnamed protein product [Sordaria macrospora k-hell]
MSSGYTYYTPSSLADNDSATPERNQLSQESHLTPNTLSNSASPALNNTQTPEESLEALNNHYQYQQLDFANNDDPFFGVNFSLIEDGSPSFLEDDFLQTANNNHFPDRTSSEPVLKTQNALLGASHLPMSPEKTPSLQTSPNLGTGSNQATFPKRSPISVNTQEVVTHRPKQPSLSDSQDSSQAEYELTPETTNSAELGDDSSVPSINVMSEQSPRVTVSNWDNINSYTLNNAQSHALHPGVNGNDFAHQTSDGNMSHSSTLARDGSLCWASDQVTGRTGVAPDNWSSAEVRSVNELAAENQVKEQNEEVDAWMAKLSTAGRTKSGFVDVNQPFIQPIDHDDDNIDPREIGAEPSENKQLSGQIYFTEKGGKMTAEDRAIISGNRNWADAPLSFPIISERHQPETSQAAINRFEQMCKDNGSIISRAATWGTRRRSIGTIDAEVENAGNFLKKLSLSRGDSLRRPSAIIQELRGLVRRPSNAKRTRAENEEGASNSTRSSVDHKESQGSLNLAPPSRTASLGKKQSFPSINTALVAMGSNVASIATAHARNGSISNTPITSPNAKSPARNLSVNFSNRFRSRSDASARKEPNNGLAGLLKSYGGPPAPLPRPTAEPKPSAEVIEIDDDSDEEDDEDGEGDSSADSSASILNIQPTKEGFEKHFLELHPKLPPTSQYLVDRIVYQQTVRYKHLLNLKKDHEQQLMNKSCPSGSKCIKSGGKAKMLKPGPNGRGFTERSEDDMPPGDKMINPNQFPANIPPPITRDLPAELECQLCFQGKTLGKPSDWTKHVHEDVSPFACTWEQCRDGNKTFKRKADWVRHENEGHRHLEWWKCIVDDCHHECYRRDNFLQHLVREHKYDEPKDKTKGAIRKAGGARHPTWQMVEKCHRMNTTTPRQEPCRFCGEQLQTWKKLTVHLAKHMEQISLPIIKLVERMEVDPDTIISPVQEPPLRHFPPPMPQNNDRRQSGQPHMQQRFDPAIHGMSHMPMRQMPMSYPSTPQQHQGFGYQPFPQPGYQPFGDLSQGMLASGSMNMPMGQQPMNQAYHNLITTQPVYTTMPMTTTAGGYVTSPISASQMGVSSQLTTPLMGTPLMGAPPNQGQFMGISPDSTSGTEAFPGMALNLNMNALGLQDPVSMGYGTMNSGGGGMMLDTSLTPTPRQGGSRPHSQNGHQHHGYGRQQSHGHVNAQFMPVGAQGPHGNVSPFGTARMPGQNGGFY